MKTTSIFLFLLLIATCVFAQGKLDRAKSDLSDQPSSESRSTNGSGSDGDASSESIGEALIGGLVVDILYFSTIGILIGDAEPRSFYDFPYAEGQHGEYITPDLEPRGKSGKLMLSNTVAVQPDIIGNDFKLNYRFIPLLGLEANHLHFIDMIGEEADLGLSSLMLNYYRIREKNVTGFWGIGATYAGSGVNTLGFSYNVGMDIYVGKPISLELYWKQSFFNESAINELRALLRYHIQKLDFHGGYINYKIGDERFPCAAVGIGYRF